MKIRLSKKFEKAVDKLSGKIHNAVIAGIKEVKEAKTINEITDCKKLSQYQFMYRVRIGNLRLFFVFHIDIENDTVVFEYLFNRGEAYKKENEDKLRRKNK